MTQEQPKYGPTVLIVGGLGYIGRHLAHFIHTNSLASHVRIVDKQLPLLANLAPEHLATVEALQAPEGKAGSYVQADASNAAHQDRIFSFADGKGKWNYIINCSGETRPAQDESVYKARSHAVSLMIGQEAAKRGVSVFVELSTAHVYPDKDSAATESTTPKPRSALAKWKLQAEEDLQKLLLHPLPLVILRIAHVYGPYTTRWLGTALCIARVWQDDTEGEMQWLGSRNVKTFTIHVDDLVRAIWQVCGWYETAHAATAAVAKKAVVFNLVDQGETTQGKMGDILKDIFKIDMAYQGSVMSALVAKLALDRAVDELNDDTLDAWGDLQADLHAQLHRQQVALPNCPLSPFLEKETVKDGVLSVDGSLFVKTVGFEFKHAKITTEEVEKVIQSYRAMNWWP